MTDLVELERRLWAAADALRANSSLTPAEYRGPVLGLIFLAFAEHRFDELRPELELKATERRPVSADDFRARGVLFVPEIARLSWLVDLPEGEDLGANVDLAMDAIEATNTGLRGVLPRGYQKLEKTVLLELVRLFAPLPRIVSGDAFGLIYEYFLAEFAANEGRRGGEFFTPQSIVRLIVDVIEPFHGKVYDPACGSGGMFVHSARFVATTAAPRPATLRSTGRSRRRRPSRSARMNLALHGLSGDIRLANSYYDDLHDAVGSFDFVMANPPFNVNGVDKSKLEGEEWNEGAEDTVTDCRHESNDSVAIKSKLHCIAPAQEIELLFGCRLSGPVDEESAELVGTDRLGAIDVRDHAGDPSPDENRRLGGQGDARD